MTCSTIEFFKRAPRLPILYIALGGTGFLGEAHALVLVGIFLFDPMSRTVPPKSGPGKNGRAVRVFFV